MNEVIVVHFLGVDDVTVLFVAQVGGVDAVGTQELSVGHTKSLTNGLSDQLGLLERGGTSYSVEKLPRKVREITNDVKD